MEVTELPPLRIACQGATNVSLDELSDLQGNLKDLSEENYVKLRNSMIEFGFSFPVFLWQDNEGKKWILDAHQRIRTLRKMRSEGYAIPDLPADFIHAKDRTEAKKKLLLLNSRYGNMTREGFDEFIDEPGAEIDESLEDYLVLPDIEIWQSSEGAEQTDQTDKSQQDETNREVICPSCSHKFTI